MKRIPITQKLFRTYSLLFLAFYLISIAAACIFIATDINKNIIDTQKQMAQTISKSVEQYFGDMNEFSLSLMNSEEFKQAVIYDLPTAYAAGENAMEPWQRIYATAYGMIEKGYRVGVATKSGLYMWMAERIVLEPYPREINPYAAYDGLGGPELYIFAQNPYLAAIVDKTESRYSNDATITLARSINRFNRFTQPQAMLEVQVSHMDFVRFMQSLASNANVTGLRVSVVAANGQTLYGDAGLAAISQPAERAHNAQWARVGGDMMQAHSIFAGEATVLYQIPIEAYYKKLTTFLGGALAFSVVMGMLLVFVTYRISKQLSKPISQMARQLKQIDLAGALTFTKVDTEIYELDVLAQTVADLNEKLLVSMHDIVALRTAELQSRLMALQSQMQPHFLHNTLATISTLSRNGEQEAVAGLCKNLSQMLRYVSEKQDEGVSLFEEVKFLRSYVDIMRARFPQAQLTLDIPMEMLHLTVPKLILQPFAENSFKYAGRTDTQIDIKGMLNETEWRVRICDNGAGFSKQAVLEIMQRCQAAAHDAGALSTHIDGMGFVNIYARLHLLYRDAMVFNLLPGSGGGVEIGGSVHVPAR